MFLISNFQKKRAIKSYIHRLGKDLARRYGKSKTYTSGQVVKTVQDENYNWLHICYAHAMYTTFKHFDEWHEDQGESCDYQCLREEITETFYSGNVDSFEAASISESGFESSMDSDSSGTD